MRQGARRGKAEAIKAYFDCVEPAERCEGDEKNQSACNPFCEWVTFGRNTTLRNSVWFCRRAGHRLSRTVDVVRLWLKSRRVA
jgi:hypothetical protein